MPRAILKERKYNFTEDLSRKLLILMGCKTFCLKQKYEHLPACYAGILNILLIFQASWNLHNHSEFEQHTHQVVHLIFKLLNIWLTVFNSLQFICQYIEFSTPLFFCPYVRLIRL